MKTNTQVTMLRHFIRFQKKKNVHLCYIPQIKIIIVTHHRDFLMKLGLEAGNVFESVDVKPDSSAMWSHRGERRVGKDQSAKL